MRFVARSRLTMDAWPYLAAQKSAVSPSRSHLLGSSLGSERSSSMIASCLCLATKESGVQPYACASVLKRISAGW